MTLYPTLKWLIQQALSGEWREIHTYASTLDVEEIIQVVEYLEREYYGYWRCIDLWEDRIVYQSPTLNY